MLVPYIKVQRNITMAWQLHSLHKSSKCGSNQGGNSSIAIFITIASMIADRDSNKHKSAEEYLKPK